MNVSTSDSVQHPGTKDSSLNITGANTHPVTSKPVNIAQKYLENGSVSSFLTKRRFEELQRPPKFKRTPTAQKVQNSSQLLTSQSQEEIRDLNQGNEVNQTAVKEINPGKGFLQDTRNQNLTVEDMTQSQNNCTRIIEQEYNKVIEDLKTQLNNAEDKIKKDQELLSKTLNEQEELKTCIGEEILKNKLLQGRIEILTTEINSLKNLLKKFSQIKDSAKKLQDENQKIRSENAKLEWQISTQNDTIRL